MSLIFYGSGAVGVLIWGSQPTDYGFMIFWLALGMICHGIEFLIWTGRIRATKAATAPETPGAITHAKD